MINLAKMLMFKLFLLKNVAINVTQYSQRIFLIGVRSSHHMKFAKYI